MLSIKRVAPANTAMQAMCLRKSDQLSLFLRLLASAISKYSRTQVIIVKNNNEIEKYFNKSLISDEIIIGMGAGTISKYMTELKTVL